MSLIDPGRVSAPARADADAVPSATGARAHTRTDTVRDALHAGTCVLAGVLITIGALLDVSGTDTDTGEQLIAAVGKDPDRFYLGNTLAAFGFAMVAAIGLAVLRLVRGRGRVLGTVGGVLLMIAGPAAAAGLFMYAAVVSVLAGPEQDAARSAALQDDLADSPETGLAFIVGFPGVLLGLLLCAVALWISRAVPRWVPLALGVGIVAALALGETDASVAGDLLLTVGTAGVGLSLWRATRPTG